MIDVHRRKAAFVVMRVPERQLLAAMRRAERVVNVEYRLLARLHRRADLVDEGPAEPRRLSLARRILQAADRRLRGEGCTAVRTAPDRDLHQRIMAQAVEVDRILVTASDRRGTRHDHLKHRVRIRSPSRRSGSASAGVAVIGYRWTVRR